MDNCDSHGTAWILFSVCTVFSEYDFRSIDQSPAKRKDVKFYDKSPRKFSLQKNKNVPVAGGLKEAFPAATRAEF